MTRKKHTLYIPVGISGSGKSTYGEKLLAQQSELKIVCPDDIRKEMTGSISDQSKNKQVFEEAFKRTEDFLHDDVSVYFSAMNTNKKTVQDLIKIADASGSEIVVILFEDSRNWRLCFDRVDNDVSNGVDRSNTSSVVTDDGRPLIEMMSDRYKTFVDSVLPQILRDRKDVLLMQLSSNKVA